MPQKKQRRGEKLIAREFEDTSFSAGIEDAAADYVASIVQSNDLVRIALEAGERQQRYIGQQMHDTLAQQLTGTALAVKAISDRLKKRGIAEADTLERVAHMLNDGVTQTRKLSRSLHPVELDGEGLMSALRELATHITTAKLLCGFDCPDHVFVDDPAVALHLYRIAQQAVQNATQRPQTTEIIISLRANKHRITLIIRDNGNIPPLNTKALTATGYRLMCYRASLVGANLTLKNSPLGGTVLCCEWPKTGHEIARTTPCPAPSPAAAA